MASDEGTAWVQLDPGSHPGVSVEVAMRDNRLTIVGVTIRRPGGVTMEELRTVPVPRLEATWNAPDSREGKRIRSTLQQPTTVAGAVVVGEAQLSASSFLSARGEESKAPTRRELTLAIPSAHRYPDAFYVKVAALYGSLVASGRQPAPALAEANNVAETTVHRWVREARRRGLMAPGRKGRAG